MKKIVSMSDAIPADIAIVKALLAEPEFSNKNINQLLQLIEEHLAGAQDVVVNKVLEKIGLNEEDLKGATKFWQLLNIPIKELDDKTWDIDWDTSKSLGKSMPLTMNVSAFASTIYAVANKKEALEKHQVKIPNSDVLINHEVKLGGGIGASVNASASFIGIEVGAQYSGEMEIDTFSQYPADTTTLTVLQEYFFKPLKVWDLNDIEENLNYYDSDNQPLGLRKVSINTEGSFKINGALTLGKAWALAGKGKTKELSAEINANIGFSKTYEHTGKIKLDFEKVTSEKDGQPVLSVTAYLTDSSLHASAFNLDVNASIKGLDKVAEKYVNKLLKEGDKLVSFLEEWSKPASKIIGETSDRLDNDNWYTPIAKLVLGSASADEAAKKLIDNELAEILDRNIQSPHLNSDKLARTAIDKLLDIFSVEGESTLINKARIELSSNIDDWKKDLDTELTQQINHLSVTAKIKFLQPLESLGENVTSVAAKTDTEIYTAIKKGLAEYQSLKEKISNALETSANIKLGLAFEAAKSHGISDEQKIKIEFLDTNNTLANTLFKKLVLGDSASASRILVTLEQEGSIRVINQAVSLGYSSAAKMSFSLNLGGIELSEIKNANAELNIKVTNTGEVFIESEVSAINISSGLSEVRTASAQLVYGLAQQAMYPDEVGNLRISYTNVDRKLFSVNEMEGMLESLDFSENKRLKAENIKVPSLINPSNIEEHLNWYKQVKKLKYAGISSLEITVPTDRDLYDTLLTINTDNAYRVTCQYWYSLFISKNNKRFIDTIMAAYAEEKQIKPHLTSVLENMKNATDFKRKGLLEIAMRSKRWGGEIDKISSVAGKKYVRLLKKIYETADSMRVIFAAIHSIDDIVKSTDTVAGDLHARAKYLTEQLNPLNEKIENSLKLWIKVDGIIDDLFSQEINQSLLCFYLILAKLTGKEQGFIRTLVTVSGKQNQRKIRIIV
ncbi:MAG: hypothetical protein JKX67_10940 [Colwellia sp.]|nr:hypothetical protein [Colwellia sp.]